MAMKEKLNQIRKPRQIRTTAAATMIGLLFFLGAALGAFSKWLDNLSLDSAIWWHRLAERLDLGNFFSDLAVWLLFALLIAVFSPSAVQAALRVLAFFAGMCAAYHLYTVFFSGFNPMSYMLIWYTITLLSPLLAALCWYAKGSGPAALVLCIGIAAVFTLSCFSVGFFYISFRGILYVLVFLGAAAALYRNPKQLLLSLAPGVLLAFPLSLLWPFH